MLDIVKMDIAREEKIEQIAKLGKTTTAATRVIWIDEELELEEGQTVKNLGNHWSDINDQYFEGYNTDAFEGTEVVFRSDVKGYKVPYFHEMWAEENNVSYEEEMALVEEYDEFYRMLGTTENAYAEAEILVSNETEFIVKEIYTPNEETNYYEVYLEMK